MLQPPPSNGTIRLYSTLFLYFGAEKWCTLCWREAAHNFVRLQIHFIFTCLVFLVHRQYQKGGGKRQRRTRRCGFEARSCVQNSYCERGQRRPVTMASLSALCFKLLGTAVSQSDLTFGNEKSMESCRVYEWHWVRSRISLGIKLSRRLGIIHN